MEQELPKRDKIRKNIEARAWTFWYDFNQRSLRESALSTEDIQECLNNASIAGLNIMLSKGKPEYEDWIRNLEQYCFYNGRCKTCITNYFGAHFDESCAKNPDYANKIVLDKCDRIEHDMGIAWRNSKARRRVNSFFRGEKIKERTFPINEQIVQDLNKVMAS